MGGSAEGAVLWFTSGRKATIFAWSLEARSGDFRESEQSGDAVSYWNGDKFF